jgi:hypothetical protein
MSPTLWAQETHLQPLFFTASMQDGLWRGLLRLPMSWERWWLAAQALRLTGTSMNACNLSLGWSYSVVLPWKH